MPQKTAKREDLVRLVKSAVPKPRKNIGSRKVHKEAYLAKKNAASQKPRKKFRWRPGTVALREIRKYQSSTDVLIRKAPFRRVVRESVTHIKESFRMQPSALQAIQEATEAYIVEMLKDANLCCIHGRRVTLMPKDLKLARMLRGERS